MKFSKAKRDNQTNLNVGDEKKLDRFLKHLAVSDRKEYLKQYIKALERKLSGAKRRMSFTKNTEREQVKTAKRKKNFSIRQRSKNKKLRKEVAKRRGIFRK